MTAVMRVMRWAEMDRVERERFLARRSGAVFDPVLREGVRRIVADVREHGNAALVRALAEFDGCEVPAGRLRVGEDEIRAAHERLPPALLAAIREGIDRIRRYNERVMEGADWRMEIDPGLEVGEKATPIASAGLFVPSGKGSFPSVLMQIGTPARVAGVPEITVVVPPVPGSDGVMDPAVLAVAAELGIERVFRANGPAGVAALAFGTESVPQVVKVLGPGSPPVQAAMLEVQALGCVTMMVLGPSESLVLADRSADPRLLAADLLNEAEHGSDSASVLVTDNAELVREAERHLAEQVERLPEPRRSYARAALGEVGGAVVVRDMAEGAEVADLYAPEHMQVVVADEDVVLSRLHHAGEILLGQATPMSAANYVIGVPASLPTGRYARVTSGVTARSFLKTTSIARATPAALERMAPAVLALAAHEGFPAHAAAVRARTG